MIELLAALGIFLFLVVVLVGVCSAIEMWRRLP